MRVSFVSVDVALWNGPRNDGQSCVTAPAGSGFGLPSRSPWASAARTSSGCTSRARDRARRDMPESWSRRLRVLPGPYVMTSAFDPNPVRDPLLSRVSVASLFAIANPV